MKTVVIALVAAAAFAANPKIGYCSQGEVLNYLCHGPAGAGPRPGDQTTTSAGSLTMDPSQWLCAGDVKDSAAHTFTPANTTWNTASGDFCNDNIDIGANSACPAFCGVGASADFMVPYPAATGYAMTVQGGHPCTGDKCDCYGVTDPTSPICKSQTTACDSFKITEAQDLVPNSGLSFANEIPFADKDGGLHARCSGSVLKAVCLPYPGDCNAPPKAGTATYANCAEWSKACTQIPTSAQWVEDYVTKVYKDGYALDGDGGEYKSLTQDPSGWGRHVPGYFHGIVPNYKTNVQLPVGQLVLVRVWTTTAAKVMPDGTNYMPTGTQDVFEASGVAFDSICGAEATGSVQTKDLPDEKDNKNFMSKRQWCWKRGKIAIYMAKDKYVVTIEGSAAVVKGVTPFDVRPICFDGAATPETPQVQPAECSTSAGSCTNMAGDTTGFKYQLGQKFAVRNASAKTIEIKEVNSIAQVSKEVTTTTDETYDLTDADIMHCFPADDSFSTGKNCTNAYPQTDPAGKQTVNAHYGLEIMKITATDATRTSFTYATGTIKSFVDNTFKTAEVSQCSSTDLAQWDLALLSESADGVLPVCYTPAPAAPTPAPTPAPPAPSP